MLVLFGSQGSGSAAVEVALLQCGLAYVVRRASTWEADSARDELRRVNPLGQIPALVLDDGRVLTESAAILIHLGLEHPASRLLPAESGARAQAGRGLVYLATNCYAAIGILDYPERWCEPGADAAVLDSMRAGTRARLHHAWDLFADQFGGDDTFAAEPGALAWLAAVVSRWAGTRAHLKRTRPALRAALERIEAHPLAAPVFARHWPPQ